MDKNFVGGIPMKQDDFYVIQYRILSYLYEQFKKQEQVNHHMIEAQRFQIPYEYWREIVYSLNQNGYVTGWQYKDKAYGEVQNLADARISIKGIEYLFKEPLMKEAKDFIEQ